MAGILTTPQAFDYTRIGTAAGTTTISHEPYYVHAVTITHRKASGNVILYDSIGTSTSVIGTIVMGTNTADDPQSYILDVRTKTALTISNTADFGCVVSGGR
jgi:hypothetical protein